MDEIEKNDIMKVREGKNIKIGLVIMASGLGKRFGRNKLVEELIDRPLIKWILDSTDNLFDKRVVVTRSDEIKNLCDGWNIKCITHNFPGKNDTVRLGISELMDDIHYCFFVPGDQPLITRKSIEKLIEEAEKYKDVIVRSKYENIVGAPVGFPKRFFDELLKLPEGKGGNWIVNNNRERVRFVEVDNEFELWDVDTVSDLERIKNVLKER